MFATTFPATVLVVAIPRIAEVMESSTADLAWVVSLPMIASAVALPILGKLGDIFGHRRIFLIGSLVAGLLALMTTTAGGPSALTAWRTLSQVAGAATMPASMALILSVTVPADRPRRVGLWGMVTAAAPAAGLSVGGPVVDAFGWQWIFVMQGTVCLAAALLALVVLRSLNDIRRPQRLDIGGALLLAVTSASALFFLSSVDGFGSLSPTPLLALAAAVVGGVAFARFERRVDNPLVPVDLARARNFRIGIPICGLVGGSYMGTFVLAPLALTGSFGLSIALASWITLVRTASLSLGGPVGGRLVLRLGERMTSMVAALVLAAGTALLALALVIDHLELFVAASVLCGLGYGASRPPVASVLVDAAGDANLGLASATERMMFQVGASLGITALATVYGGSDSAEDLAAACLLGAAIALAGSVFSARLRDVDR